MELAEIHKFEQWIENTVEGVLSSVCKHVYRPKLEDTSQSPRVTFNAVIGEQFQNQKFIIATPPGWIYSTYGGRIELTVTSNRTEDFKSQAQDELVGVLRMRCHQYYFDEWQNAQMTNDPAALPVIVTDIRPAENDDSVVDEDNLDKTLLAYSIIFAINKAALPDNI